MRDDARDDTLLRRADRRVLWLAHVDPCRSATGLDGAATRYVRPARPAGAVPPAGGAGALEPRARLRPARSTRQVRRARLWRRLRLLLLLLPPLRRTTRDVKRERR